MTLINYLNRVHFADGILEEALWAELEKFKGKRIMLLSDPEHLSGELSERFYSGLPVRSRIYERTDTPERPTEAVALSVAQDFRDQGCDILIAYGPDNVVELTKIVRLLVSHDAPLAGFSVAEGGEHRIKPDMPVMICVPTICGFASAFDGFATVRLTSGETIDIASDNMIPTVTICDPTLSVKASAESQASAGVTAISRCVETLLSPHFNPPADGMALDGLNRALKSIHRAIRHNQPDARREMMAAGLNAALVQQKGRGLAYVISASLDAVSAGVVDQGALTRLILPEVLRYYGDRGMIESDALQDALGVEDGKSAAEMLKSSLAGLPLPDSLAEMGIHPDEITRAASLAARHRALGNGPRVPVADDILSILHSVQ